MLGTPGRIARFHPSYYAPLLTGYHISNHSAYDKVANLTSTADNLNEWGQPDQADRENVREKILWTICGVSMKRNKEEQKGTYIFPPSALLWMDGQKSMGWFQLTDDLYPGITEKKPKEE